MFRSEEPAKQREVWVLYYEPLLVRIAKDCFVSDLMLLVADALYNTVSRARGAFDLVPWTEGLAPYGDCSEGDGEAVLVLHRDAIMNSNFFAALKALRSTASRSLSDLGEAEAEKLLALALKKLINHNKEEIIAQIKVQGKTIEQLNKSLRVQPSLLHRSC
eukprot:m51a1_g6865 hypothetical protein (161) ;mRNA; r:152907-153776